MTTSTTTTIPGATDAPIPSATLLKRVLLGVECAALYVMVPWFYDMKQYPRTLIPFLVVVGIVCFVWLLLDTSFDRKRLWNAASFKKHLPRIFATWVLGTIVMALFVLFIQGKPWLSDGARENVSLFGFLQRAPAVWIIVMILYPLFSVYPQEIILRTFFFHRYKRLFTHPAAMIVANGLVFAWVHVIFENWIAVALCVPAGMLFAYTYWSSRSTIASGFEHALFGNAMWTVGLGWFFFAGSVQ